MRKFRYHSPGTAPATLVPPPEQAGCMPTLRLISYDAHSFQEREIGTIDELLDSVEGSKVNWINVDGLGDVATLRKLGEYFRIHPLALEDVFNTGQRPHIDEYEDQLFMVLQMVYQEEQGELVFEQMSVFLGEKYVITIQEDPGDMFDPIRKRLREGRGNARFMRSDYLAYTLIDTAVDQYFPLSEALGDSVECMEEELLQNPTREKLRQIHELRQALAQLRRAVWPTREVITHLLRDDSGLVAEKTKPFLRDCLDHVLAIVDLLESYRDITTSFMDLYVSSLSMRTNEIMRVLTIISSIFIPLTFIAGLYGMNFVHMPELHWRLGYPFALVLMLLVAVGMIAYFKRKNWL
jgi:magnesium transporter